MPEILNTNISLWSETGDLVTLEAGASLPAWAAGKVGAHCLVAPSGDVEQHEPAEIAEGSAGELSATSDALGSDAPEVEVPLAPAQDTSAPDFTKPARRTRTSKA